MLRLLSFFFLAVVLASCDSWDAKAPPETTAGQSVEHVPDASVRAEIAVSSRVFANDLMARYRTEPLWAGDTDWVSAKVLIGEKSLEKRLVNKIVTPAKAAGCITKQVASSCTRSVPRRITDCVRRFRLNCVRTVWEVTHFPCMQDVQECWPEVKEVIVQQWEPHILVHDKLVPTSVRVRYDLKLRSADVEALDAGIKVTAGVRLSVSIDLRQGFLSESITVKGALACDSDFKVMAQARAAVIAGPEIDLTLTDLGFDVQKICIPGVVELADAALTNPSHYITNALLGPVLKKQLIQILDKQLEKSVGDDLKFRDDVAKLADKIKEPIVLSDDLWLRVNPKRLLVSQFGATGTGDNNRLLMRVAIAATPEIIAGGKPESSALPNPLPVDVSNDIGRGFELLVRGTVPLKFASEELSKVLKREIDEKLAQYPLTAGPVRIYQSGPQFVIEMKLLKRSNGSAIGTIYLSATPHLDEDSRAVRLKDVKFDVDSRRVLLKSADWLLSGVIEKTIEREARFDYGGLIAKVEEAAGLRVSSPSGTGLATEAIAITRTGEFRHKGKDFLLVGKLHGVDVKNIWIADHAMHVTGLARGEIDLNFRPRL